MRQTFWMSTMAALLALGTLAPAQAAARFYADQLMAYPSVIERRDGGVVLAFLRENGEVNGYYCQCNGISEKRMNLDKYGKASIVAVFQLDLDSEGETTFVLSRSGDKLFGLHAYRYERSGGKMFKVATLQPALDAIVRGAKAMDEAGVRAALARLQLIDYSIAYAPTGVAEFDAIEHAHGTLAGYFNIDGELLPGKPADAPAFAYKKTFQEKAGPDGHFLTVTYLLGKGWEAGRAPSYHVKWITWETQPQRFAASQDGPFIEYDVNCCVGSVFARGQYAQGKRTGQWHFEEPNTIRSSGAFVDDKAEGPWTYESGDETTTGQMQRGQRTGRWEVSPGVAEWRAADMHSFTGYDHFVKDRLNGPSERRIDGVLQWQGNYVNGKKQGQWVEPGGGGLYVDDVKQGP